MRVKKGRGQETGQRSNGVGVKAKLIRPLTELELREGCTGEGHGLLCEALVGLLWLPWVQRGEGRSQQPSVDTAAGALARMWVTCPRQQRSPQVQGLSARTFTLSYEGTCLAEHGGWSGSLGSLGSVASPGRS